jgi:S1-C subfamily serine protease
MNIAGSILKMLARSKAQLATRVAAVLLSQAGPAGAVLFYATGDPSYNTNTPSKTYTNSGWQYVGHWNMFTATAIASNYFITAKHIGGAVGDPFLFHGTNYLATALYEDAASDLAVWRVAGTLAPFAPLYTKPNERNKALVVIGRGTTRGAGVRVKKVLKGWEWGD